MAGRAGCVCGRGRRRGGSFFARLFGPGPCSPDGRHGGAVLGLRLVRLGQLLAQALPGLPVARLRP